jgi:glycine cleavage system H protein
MELPDDLLYSSDHEWVRREEDGARMGITDYAQDALGDVVFVELPAVGTKVTAADALSEVESTKSVSEIYAPLTGTVTAVNTELADQPQRLNEDPYGDGWICLIAPDDPAQFDELLTPAAYQSLLDAE